MKPPSNLTFIVRQLGDFIDYSDLPLQSVRHEDISTCDWLVTSMVLPITKVSNKVTLPFYLSGTGWGVRSLTRKEIFGIWGFTPLLSFNC